MVVDGDVVVVDRWREHLPYLAIAGTSATDRRVGAVVEKACEFSAAAGLSAVLSPLVHSSRFLALERGGMRLVRRVRVLSGDVATLLEGLAGSAEAPPASAGDTGETVSLCPAGEERLRDILAVDAASFDDFWRFDSRTLRQHLDWQDVLLADAGDEAVGYVMFGAREGSGSIGRLAVRPQHRGVGLGGALLGAAVRALAARGARQVSLTCEAENAIALGLYRSCGFVLLPDRLGVLAIGNL